MFNHIIGLDANAAKEAFGEFLGRTNLRGDQTRFIDLIISRLTINGIIDKRMPAEPPFTEVNDQGVFGCSATRTRTGPPRPWVVFGRMPAT